MYQETERTRRVGELIKREIADILLREMNDSRLRMACVGAVTVSRDLRYATVFFTSLGNRAPVAELARELNDASGTIRKHLSTRLRLKRVPGLQFRVDESVERGIRLSKFLDEIRPPESSD